MWTSASYSTFLASLLKYSYLPHMFLERIKQDNVMKLLSIVPRPRVTYQHMLVNIAIVIVIIKISIYSNWHVEI